MKLLLFDIDGTLISSGGAGRRAMIAAAESVLQQPVQHDFLRFAGMTDRLILQNLLKGNTISNGNLEGTIDDILDGYVVQLAVELGDGEKVRAHPGVRALLDAVAKPPFTIGLVTGNIAEGARLKLNAIDLYRHFPFGAFGCDAVIRNDLPPLAVQRAAAYAGVIFDPRDVWVIGDTPHDIECGKVNGYRTLAVATGGSDYDQLATHHPDLLVENLADTTALLTAFAG